ncbi:MAG TPA: hypothetical protein VNW47_00420 [Terriglobales bacterium]|jgi:hypothetical protein|nr:hypothetical protein [Terriglobales bacterium]
MVGNDNARVLYAVLALFLLCLFTSSSLSAQNQPVRVVHVFVALADNEHQGIVPVPPRLGNGLDAAHNLYWGAGAGVKTFFGRSSDWKSVACWEKPKVNLLERCVFKHRMADVYLVADAYRGDEIRAAIIDFLDAAAGASPEPIVLSSSPAVTLSARGGSNLVAYVGHDGLMDFKLPLIPRKKNEIHRDAIILACASKQYFAEVLRASGAHPLLWTTNLMAPEAYTLKAALDGWIEGESDEQVHERAAAAYDKYQKCGIRGARRLFATGW